MEENFCTKTYAPSSLHIVNEFHMKTFQRDSSFSVIVPVGIINDNSGQENDEKLSNPYYCKGMYNNKLKCIYLQNKMSPFKKYYPNIYTGCF